MAAPVEDYIYRVVGIDPGTETLGWAVIDLDLKHQQITIRAAGTYYASRLSSSPFQDYELACGNRLQRIKLLGQAVRSLLGYYQPHRVLSESPFLGRFAASYESLTQCMMALRKAVYDYDPSTVLWGIDPISVKKNVGFEVKRKMSKQQLKEGVRDALRKLRLNWADGVNLETLTEHAVDAIAVALWEARKYFWCG